MLPALSNVSAFAPSPGPSALHIVSEPSVGLTCSRLPVPISGTSNAAVAGWKASPIRCALASGWTVTSPMNLPCGPNVMIFPGAVDSPAGGHPKVET